MKSSSAGFGARMSDLSFLISMVALLLFAAALRASYAMTEPSAYRLPRVVALVGLAVAALEAGMSLMRPRATTPAAREAGGLGIGICIGFTAGYFVLVPVVGFVPATALAMAGFGALTRFPRRNLMAVLAVAVPLILYLTFGKLLQAPLPSGVWGALSR